jgi:3-hydroxyisobutyrate dehydrogenase-like beta-hydroxyacid dehydrogenase
MRAHGTRVESTQGKNIVLCGGAGSGQAVKICNNLVLAISMIGTTLCGRAKQVDVA